MTDPFVTPVASSYHVVNPVTHVNPVALRNTEFCVKRHSASDSHAGFSTDADVATLQPHGLHSLNYSLLAQAQSTCPDVALMRQSTRLRVVPRPVEGESLLGEVSTGVFRPLLPRAFRDEAIWALHRGAHPGIRSTVKLVSCSFVWPKMAAYTRSLVRA